MSNQLTTKTESWSFCAKSLDEAIKYAELLAKSTMVPKTYQGKAGDIIVAIQMGQELGLKPMQALQSIAVINGKPSMYGDALMALVQGSPLCEDIIEMFDPVKNEAKCIAKRKGRSDVTHIYTKDMAMKAGLWNKQGPWTTSPKRMLQMRARGFALRDQFPDILQGLITEEEARDYPMENVTPQSPQGQYASKADHLAAMLDTNDNDEPIEVEIIDVVGDNLSPAEDTQALATELNMLLDERDVSPEIISQWLIKAQVSTIEEMPEDTLRKCIAHVLERY